MSNTINQSILDWKTVEDTLSRRTPSRYNEDRELDAKSQLVLRDAYVLWYLATVDTLNSFGTPLTRDVTGRWLNAISLVSVHQLVETLKESSHLFVSGNFDSYDAFKQHLRVSFPSVGAILAPIKRIIDDWYQNHDTDSLYLIYSWTLFLSRLNLPGLAFLEEEALSKYLRIERDLQEDGFSSEEASVLENWFPKTLEDQVFLMEHFEPSHGPGATADAGRVLQQKYAALALDPALYMLHSRLQDLDTMYPRPAVQASLRTSATIFVPKSLGSYRTISMESSSIMWHQKGVSSALRSLIKARKHYLRRRYIPEEQQPNQHLAFIGSVDGSFATIDLSSASDTVSWSLVKKWFGNTSLYPWLLWTRSTHTLLPTGDVIKLRKFAPMGSDLSFPIETIIFAAITECAIRECGGDPKLSSYRVFGDDIVVEDEYASTVLRRLKENGFIPNWDKSFLGPQPHGFFRESCGGFFFNGVDITPTRLSRRFDGYSNLSTKTPERISSLIQLANDCYSRYPSVRLWLVRQLLGLPKHLRPPFSHDGTTGLFSTQPSNFHLNVKESLTLQTEIYTFGGVKVRKRKKERKWEDIRYFECLRRIEKRSRLTWPEDRVDVYVSPVPPPTWSVTRGVLLP